MIRYDQIRSFALKVEVITVMDNTPLHSHGLECDYIYLVSHSNYDSLDTATD